MWVISGPLPRIGSKLKKFMRRPSTWLYMQRVEGRRAHCWLVMARPSRTGSAGPPVTAMRNILTISEPAKGKRYCR